MGSTVIAIPDGDQGVTPKEKNKFGGSLASAIGFVREMSTKFGDLRKLVHSIKVGVALVSVSLLYLLDPLYNQVGDNAMWAIMTVVVIFEFYAGATLSKGLNRGIGTVLGGGLGCLAAAFAQEVGGTGKGIVVGICVFIFGATATYSRLVPSIKKRYDYGAVVFILTFNLVVVSGLRAEKVLQLARERLTAIMMGFVVCIFTSLLVFPIWASDELHHSLTSKFDHLARSIEGCLEEYFKDDTGKENEPSFIFGNCKSVLHSKAKDETLANFARWEPWHGKFGISYPWKKYLKIGEILRDMAANVLSLKGCLRSPKQASKNLRGSIKEPCEVVVSSLAWTLRELGMSIQKMSRCGTAALVTPKLKSVRQELSLIVSPTALAGVESCADALEISSFVFTLVAMVDQMEELIKEVEELGDVAAFRANTK